MRHRRGLRRVRVSFTGDHLTRFGGVLLLHGFFQRLRLRRSFHREIHFSQRNNTYSIPEMMLALLYPIMLGLERLDTTELLRPNGVFQVLTGLPAYPNPTALRRFLRRFASAACPSSGACTIACSRNCASGHTLSGRVLLDLDSTVLTLYGHQEKARIGYNPRKRGSCFR